MHEAGAGIDESVDCQVGHLSYTRELIRYSLGMAPLTILTLGAPLSSEIPYGNIQLRGEVSLWRR